MKPRFDLSIISILLAFSIVSGLIIRVDESALLNIQPRGDTDEYDVIFSKRADKGNVKDDGSSNRSRSRPSIQRSGTASEQQQSGQRQQGSVTERGQERRVSSSSAHMQRLRGSSTSQRPQLNSLQRDIATSRMREPTGVDVTHTEQSGARSGQARANSLRPVSDRLLNGPPPPPPQRARSGFYPPIRFPPQPRPVLYPPTLPQPRPVLYPPIPPQPRPVLYPPIPPAGEYPRVPGPFGPAAGDPPVLRKRLTSSEESTQTQHAKSNDSNEKRSVDVRDGESDEDNSILEFRDLSRRVTGDKDMKGVSNKANSGGGSVVVGTGSLGPPQVNSPPRAAQRSDALEKQQSLSRPSRGEDPLPSSDPAAKSQSHSHPKNENPVKPKANRLKVSRGHPSGPTDKADPLVGTEPSRDIKPIIGNKLRSRRNESIRTETQGSILERPNRPQFPNEFPPSVPQSGKLNKLLAQAQAEKQGPGIQSPLAVDGPASKAHEVSASQRIPIGGLGHVRHGLGPGRGQESHISGQFPGNFASPTSPTAKRFAGPSNVKEGVGNGQQNWGGSFDFIQDTGNNARGGPRGSILAPGVASRLKNDASDSGSEITHSSTGSVT